MSLIEALNGPCPVRVQPPPTPQTIHQTLVSSNNSPNIDGDPNIQVTEVNFIDKVCS